MRLHSTRLWGFLATLSVTALLVLLVGPGASVGSRRVTTAALGLRPALPEGDP
jgi:hypothetical protein